MLPIFSKLTVKKQHLIVKIIPIILLAFFLIQSSTAMIHKSATWDETYSFGLGEYLLKNMRWDVPGSILHPPLSFYISSIPFLFIAHDNETNWKYDDNNKRDIQFLGNVDNFRGQILLSSDLNRNNILLYLSRLMIIFVALLLGYYIYLWSNSIYGENGSLLSLYFFSFCPNMLAHAHLTTPDMTLTAFSFIASYYYWKSLNYSSRKYSAIGGIFFGLALMSKFTSILLFPIFFIFLIFFRINKARLDVLNNILFYGIGLFILFLGYGFNITPYLQGIIFQLEHASKGHSFFLLGQYSTSGWWYYFIVAFFIKTPIPTLILSSASLFFIAKRFRLNYNINELCLLVPVLFIFSFFSINHQSIGLRYILPIYPFLYVLIGKIMAIKSSGKLANLLFSLILLWYFLGSINIYPHYLAYFNESILGPKNGYKYLIDSNLDWGQDLKGLKDYMDKNNIDKIYLSYFGTDLPDRYGIKYNWLPSPLFTKDSLQNEMHFPIKGLIAISATNLQGLYFNNKNIYAWLKNYEPIAKIGYSIFIYDTK